MSSGLKNVKLAGVDALFGSSPEVQAAIQEGVVDIPLAALHPFKNHPFKVLEDESMQELVESVLQNGVLVPALARKQEDGSYELIAGHRRKRACELAGLAAMPAIVREMTDDVATLAMVSSNQQREQILPSERAFAYKMMMDAMRHQGSFDTSSQLGTKSRSDEFLAAKTGVSRNQIQRFIRLTELIPDLLTMVDKNALAINTAVELSYLTLPDQQTLIDVMHAHAARPSMAQSRQLRLLTQKQGKLTKEGAKKVLLASKPVPVDLRLRGDQIQKFFPEGSTTELMMETIVKLLEQWSNENARS